MGERFTIGISTCLTGRAVRYDGGHKRNDRLLHALGAVADLVPVCPESEAGFGIPREPVDLFAPVAEPRVRGAVTGYDCTDRLVEWAKARLERPNMAALDGFVFRCKSPSCAVGSIAVHEDGGAVVEPAGVGLFARMFAARFPLAPIEEDRNLLTPQALARFMDRLELGRAWRGARSGGPEASPWMEIRKLLARVAPGAAEVFAHAAGHGAQDRVERCTSIVARALAHPALAVEP